MSTETPSIIEVGYRLGTIINDEENIIVEGIISALDLESAAIIIAAKYIQFRVYDHGHDTFVSIEDKFDRLTDLIDAELKLYGGLNESN